MLQNEECEHVLLRSKEFGAERFYTMQMSQCERGLAYYKCDVTVQEAVFHYQFYLVTKDSVFYYTQYRITDYIPEESRDFKILVDYQGPEWVKSAVFYQIFPDRFCNGDPSISVKDKEYSYQGYDSIQVTEWDTPVANFEQGHNLDFYGGDLYGIMERLDYLQELGVTALYLNPIFISPTTHKYDSLDYFHVDPHLGGDEALSRLTKELHKRGMKLILDISINHTSSSAQWFNMDSQFYDSKVGAYQNKKAKEREFYFFGPNNEYDTWCGVPTMPKLNYGSSTLRNRIYREKDSVLKKWLQEPYNIDGWRFDVADVMARNETADYYHEVWKEIRHELKAEKSAVFLVAEDWADCSEMFQGDEWDSTMNYYGCARPIREFVGEVDLFHNRNEILRGVKSKLTAKQLRNRIEQFYARMPYVLANEMFNLLDSHDVARLHNNEKVHPMEYLGAVIMLFTLPGTPNIYYGDEKLLAGRITDNEGFRYPMDWSESMSDKVHENYTFYQKLARLKHDSDILSDGGFQVVYDEGYVFAYVRFTEEQLLLIVVSSDENSQEIEIPFSYFGVINDCPDKDFFGRMVEGTIESGTLRLKVPAHQSYMILNSCSY